MYLGINSSHGVFFVEQKRQFIILTNTPKGYILHMKKDTPKGYKCINKKGVVRLPLLFVIHSADQANQQINRIEDFQQQSY